MMDTILGITHPATYTDPLQPTQRANDRTRTTTERSTLEDLLLGDQLLRHHASDAKHG